MVSSTVYVVTDRLCPLCYSNIFVQVKKVEDVVYDLSLRNLVPKGGASA
jgi:hypothetical protein